MPFQLQDPTIFKAKSFVNGTWIDGQFGKRFQVHNPSTCVEIAQCPDLDDGDTRAAIDSAQIAFTSFRKTTPRCRAALLRKWHDLMIENLEDLAMIITLENGKPLADARTEVKYAAAFFEWFSEEAPRVYGDTIQPSNSDCRMITIKEPIGVCSLITPWNFPAAMITRKIGPALAAGCSVVVKAPGETPLTALALAELGHRAGVPAGVVNVITALANTAKVGEMLTRHPTIKKVSFTGSTAVGKILMSQSSSTLKKLSFELGGNAPFLVFEDADLDAAVRGLIASKFRISGQTCVCANRILVHKAVHDKFVKKLLAAVEQFQIGDGCSEGTTHGPLIHDRAVAKVHDHVKDAIAKGATLLYGGEPLPHLGPNYFGVTVLTDMKPGMAICNEETFGPVAAFFTFDTESEAISLANDSEVGLAGYFFSRDVSRCWRVAEALEVGMVGVNVGAISDPSAPFGGLKQSGFGKEGSKYGMDDFVTTKMVMFSLEA